jgi:peptidoglycan hydrolase-like protein with peptidoglycan-binding domain
MSKKIIKLTESDLTRIVKRVIAEQEDNNYKKAIQCFLNKKGIKDDSGQSLKIDGSIGNYPKSKTAQAIHNYQSKIGVYPADGVWGENTMSKMPNRDKEMFKQCVSDYGDIFDKGAHWFGLD